MEGNGFTFESYNHGDFVWAVKRALRVFAHPEEYLELRQCAYETTIDVSQVAWAWSSEFHRLRNAMYTRSEVVCQAITASATEDSGLLSPASKLVTFRWSGAGSNVVLKGSFDGWTAEWTLTSTMDMNNDGEGFEGTGRSRDQEKSIIMRLRPDEYMYKFKVDGLWTVADDQDKKQDDAGFVNNFVRVV